MFNYGIYNLGREVFTHVHGSLGFANRMFYHQAYQLSKRYEKSFCPHFKVLERTILILFDVMCILLQESYLIDAVPSASNIIPKVRCYVDDVRNNLINIHNYFIIHRDDKVKLRKFLDDFRKGAECLVKSIKILCNMLIENINFLSDHFIHAAACLSTMLFAANQLNCRVTNTIVGKSEALLYGNKSLCFSVSIKGTGILENIPISKPTVYIQFWLRLLEKYCRGVDVLYEKFLNREIKQRCGCTINDVNEVIRKSKRKLGAWTQVLVLRGEVKLVNIDENMFSVMGVEDFSNDSVVLQQLYNKVFLEGEKGSSQDVDSNDGDSNGIQQLCSQYLSSSTAKIGVNLQSSNGSAIPEQSCDKVVVSCETEGINSQHYEEFELTMMLYKEPKLLDYRDVEKYFADIGDNTTSQSSADLGLSEFAKVLLDSESSGDLSLSESDKVLSDIIIDSIHLSFPRSCMSYGKMSDNFAKISGSFTSQDDISCAQEELLSNIVMDFDIEDDLPHVTPFQLSEDDIKEIDDIVSTFLVSTESRQSKNSSSRSL